MSPDPRRGWWNMTCWRGLSDDQQRRLIEHGNLPLGYEPEGPCPNPATVAIETETDVAPGPRFYCRSCAIAFLTPDTGVLTDRHALYVGSVLGSAMNAGLRARPVVDDHGNYRNTITIELPDGDGRDWTITVVVPPPPDDWRFPT